MKKYYNLLTIVLVLVNASCRTSRNFSGKKDDGKIEIVFVQVNDVYEIAPVTGGKEGGMARVATLKKQYKSSNPNTFLVMAGDFVSPSVYNNLKYQDKPIRGAQMIESMNAAGMDLVVFGNHEFDIKEKELQERINESGFVWIASNTFHKVHDKIAPFTRIAVSGEAPFPEKLIMNIKDSDGTTAKIGFLGLTLPANPANYVSYKDPLSTARELYYTIKDSVDAVVAITHQDVEDDIRLAKELPQLAVILGGHEHNKVFNQTGKVYITKAHSNARSAFVVKLRIDKEKHTLTVPTPELKSLNETVPLDSNTDKVVQKWVQIAEDNFASLGFEAKKIVLQTGEPLDGRESQIRFGSTNFTRLITLAMARACPQADAVIFNSGSLRLDDILTPPVTQYDIIRSLPFGGGITEVDMKGSLLIHILQTGLKNIDNGGFLQYHPLVYDKTAGLFTINNAPIDPQKIYRIAMTDFLMTGNETKLSFLNPKNPEITKVYNTEKTEVKADIRLALIKYLESTQ